MAPKRSSRVTRATVKTTRKVVQETVEVSVVKEKEASPGKKKIVEVTVQEKTEVSQPQEEGYGEREKGEGEKEVHLEEKPITAGVKEAEKEKMGEQPPQEKTVVAELEKAADKRAVEGSTETEEETQPPLDSEEDGRRREEAEPRRDRIGDEKKAEKEEKRRVKTKRPGKKRRKASSGLALGGFGERRGYKRYMFKVLKQVHPDLGVSSLAMTVLDSFVKDMLDRLIEEASNLTELSGRATLSTREIQAAVRLVLPGELGQHALTEAKKAVSNYITAEKTGS